MPKNYSCSSGFTLIEMLISVLLLTLIVGTMMFAFKNTLQQFEHTGSAVPETALRYHQLRTLLQSAFPYVTLRRDSFGNSAKNGYETFFKAEERSVEFVSEQPLLQEGMALCRISCEEGGLYYRETPLFGYNRDFNTPETAPDTPTLRLFDDLEECSFRYAYPATKEKGDDAGQPFPSLVTLELRTARRPLEFAFHLKEGFDNLRLVRAANTENF